MPSSTLTFLCITIFVIFCIPQTRPRPSQILYDIYPFIRVYTNGTIQRFIGQDYAPPSLDPATAVQSTDVHFSNLTARIYVPPNIPNPSHRFPLLIYFHGGGFFTESAFSPHYHRHLNLLVSKARVIAVSVNYRLAPEHPLPTAYYDSWLALKWAFSHAAHPWLRRHADLGRVYLGGDSAGGNIAQRMAVWIGKSDSDPGIRLMGMFLNCPYFLGKTPIGNESAPAYAYVAAQMAALWNHAYPNSTGGLDDPMVNPEMDPGLKRVGCRRVLVYVAGNDLLKYRGWAYGRALARSGWRGKVKVVEVGGEGHVFYLAKPGTPHAVAMLRVLAAFLNGS